MLRASEKLIRSNHPEKNILYITAEEFCQEFISAIQGGKRREFRQEYRNLGVLIIYDIQYLSGKEAICEELSYMFDELYDNNVAILLSMDCEIYNSGLTERICSRLSRGLMIEIVANEQTSSNSQFLSEYTGNSVLEKMLKEKRIIFPLTDFDGNVTGFSGRNLSTNPKYKNYGYGFFGNFSTMQNTIILAEGVIHVLTAERKGYDNVIGFFDERIIVENIEALHMSGKRFIVFSDSDNYGLRLAKRIVSLLHSKQIKAAVYSTDMALDLDDFFLQRTLD